MKQLQPPEKGRLIQRYRRLLKILEILWASPKGMTPKQILQALSPLGHPYNIKERRLYEDLLILSETFENSGLINENGCYKAILPEGQVAFSAQETRLCLKVLGSMNGNLLSREFRIQRDNLFERFSSLYPKIVEDANDGSQRYFSTSYFLDDNVDESQVFSRLSSAIESYRQVNIEFREPTLGRILGCSPLRLLFYIRAWYLIGYCNPPSGLKQPMHKELRTFRVDNIESVEVLFSSFHRTKIMDVDEALNRAWGLNFHSPVQTAVLKFSSDLAGFIAKNPRHSSAFVEHLPDGSLLYRVSYYQNSREFLMWIRQYGPEVEVLEPLELREQIIEDISRSINHYLKCSIIE